MPCSSTTIAWQVDFLNFFLQFKNALNYYHRATPDCTPPSFLRLRKYSAPSLISQQVPVLQSAITEATLAYISCASGIQSHILLAESDSAPTVGAGRMRRTQELGRCQRHRRWQQRRERRRNGGCSPAAVFARAAGPTGQLSLRIRVRVAPLPIRVVDLNRPCLSESPLPSAIAWNHFQHF